MDRGWAGSVPRRATRGAGRRRYAAALGARPLAAARRAPAGSRRRELGVLAVAGDAAAVAVAPLAVLGLRSRAAPFFHSTTRKGLRTRRRRRPRGASPRGPSARCQLLGDSTPASASASASAEEKCSDQPSNRAPRSWAPGGPATSAGRRARAAPRSRPRSGRATSAWRRGCGGSFSLRTRISPFAARRRRTADHWNGVKLFGTKEPTETLTDGRHRASGGPRRGCSRRACTSSSRSASSRWGGRSSCRP